MRIPSRRFMLLIACTGAALLSMRMPRASAQTLQIGADDKGKGTLSYATKIVAHRDVVELENFDTQPVMLTEITARKAKTGFN